MPRNLFESEKKPNENVQKIGSIYVSIVHNGPPYKWEKDRKLLIINQEMFADLNEMNLFIIRNVAYQTGLRNAFSSNPLYLLELSSKYHKSWVHVLRWQGLKFIKSDKRVVKKFTYIQQDTYLDEFINAIDYYILHGYFPKVKMQEVARLLQLIPKTQNKEIINFVKSDNLINIIATGEFLKFDGENFYTYILPMMDYLEDLDFGRKQSNNEEYSPNENFSSSERGPKSEIPEEDILRKVTTFYGGFYREYASDFDIYEKKLVQKKAFKSVWNIDLSKVSEEVYKSKRIYEGVYFEGEVNTIPLHARALPILSTMKPKGVFVLYRDSTGAVTIEKKHGVVTNEEAIRFSFDYVIMQTTDNAINDLPSAKDYSYNTAGFPDEIEKFVENTKIQSWMSNLQKAKRIAKFIKNTFTYPEDDNAINRIDRIYNSSGFSLYKSMWNEKKLHCVWASALMVQMCKKAGIACRIVKGSSVGVAEKQKNYAIVKHKNSIDHASCEVWDDVNLRWIEEGYDPTPHKKQDKDDQQNEFSDEQLEGDFNSNFIEYETLEESNIRELYEQLEKKAISYQKFLESFANQDEKKKEDKEKFSIEEWHELKAWLEQINNTVIPSEDSISGKQSTIKKEWETIFSMIRSKRVVNAKKNMTVRRSQGEYLIDPVSTYIDLMSKDDDPHGFNAEVNDKKEKIMIEAFADDMILDISSSMSNNGAIVEQRKMVMSALYNMRAINIELKKIEKFLVEPLQLTSQILTFGTRDYVVKNSDTPLTEDALIKINHALKDKLDSSSNGLVLALATYFNSFTELKKRKIRTGKTKVVLTIVTDGEVSNQEDCIMIIKKLREIGVIVQGIGFGKAAESIKVVCHNPNDPDAAVVLQDFSEIMRVKYKFMRKNLKKL